MFENEMENGMFMDGEGLDLGSEFDGGSPFDNVIEDIFKTDELPETPAGTAKDETQATTAPEKSEPLSAESEIEPEESEPAPIQTAEEPTIENIPVEENVSERENTKTESEENKNEGESNSAQTGSVEPAEKVAEVSDDAEAPDLFTAAIAKAEEKQAESTKSSLIDKLPVFSYAKAEEEIADTSKTFDQLRNEKAEDFPELDDGTSVTWKMVYGTITKSIPTPKKTTIISMKKKIEDSKEFMDMLKKAKGDTVCKVTPSVVAKKKGVIPPYKGVYHSVEDAADSGAVIAFVPSSDGKVYEVRRNKIGTFIAESYNGSILQNIRAGFIPALPKIPYQMLSEIIAFFKSYVVDTGELEAYVNIYWSLREQKYYVHVPRQWVTKDSVNALIPGTDDDDEYILVMEVHSHNSMEAAFSFTDNQDERATRLYTVIGRMDKVFPDITTRFAVGGKHVEIRPSLVFDCIEGEFPEMWRQSVKVRQPKCTEADK